MKLNTNVLGLLKTFGSEAPINTTLTSKPTVIFKMKNRFYNITTMILCRKKNLTIKISVTYWATFVALNMVSQYLKVLIFNNNSDVRTIFPKFGPVIVWQSC